MKRKKKDILIPVLTLESTLPIYDTAYDAARKVIKQKRELQYSLVHLTLAIHLIYQATL